MPRKSHNIIRKYRAAIRKTYGNGARHLMDRELDEWYRRLDNIVKRRTVRIPQ